MNQDPEENFMAFQMEWQLSGAYPPHGTPVETETGLSGYVVAPMLSVPDYVAVRLDGQSIKGPPSYHRKSALTPTGMPIP